MYNLYQVVSDKGCGAVRVIAEGTVRGRSRQAIKCAVGADLLKNHDDKGSAFHGFAVNLVTGCPAHGWRIVFETLNVLR